MGKVFTEDTENKEDTVLGVRNDGIRKDGVCVTTAFTDDSCNTEFLIDRFSMNDINNGTLVGSMSFTVADRMADRTFLGFRLKGSHKIKKQRFR